MFWPCETRTSICRNLATISSGLYRFLAITVLLDVKDIPQVGPLQWGWIIMTFEKGNTLSRGRPRGAKNRLTARVLEDMHQVWTELVSEGRIAPAESKTTGLSALRIMARERPAE